MVSFKKWLQKENLAGPGGGPQFNPDSQEYLGKDNSFHGVGAFPSYDKLPTANPTISSKYADKRFMSKKDNFLDGIFSDALSKIKKRGEKTSIRKVSEPFVIELYRGFDAKLEELETTNGQWVLSPKKSEQGMLWFSHIFISGHDPVEYVKGRGEWLLTYPLTAKKHYEVVTYEDGSTEQNNCKDILDKVNHLENNRFYCLGNFCIELPENWFFTYKSQKFIATTNKIFVSKQMITKNN